MVKYQPINAKLALTKVGKLASFDDERPVESTAYIQLAPRLLTYTEQQKVQKDLNKYDTNLKLIEKSNQFENRKDLDKVESTQVAPILETVFEKRI